MSKIKPDKIIRGDAALVVIDMQEKILPAMEDPEQVSASCEKLIKGAVILGVPVIYTQQYSKGLGRTVDAVADAGGEPFMFVEKTSFSVMDEPDFAEVLKGSGKGDIIVAGIEAHVCVLQSVLDMLAEGYRVFVDADSVASRKRSDKKHALMRLSRAGAVVTTTEAILFEILGGAREEGFKEISALVK